MTGDPFDYRCRQCGAGLLDPLDFCPGTGCEQTFAARRAIRRASVIITLEHGRIWRRRLGELVRRRRR